MELLDFMQSLTIQPIPKENEEQFFTYITGDINNIPTEIVLVEYTHKKLLIVTQYQKIGSMVMVQKDQVIGPMGTIDIFSSKVVYGATADEIQIAARYLAEIINTTKPLCVMIDLKSYDMETINACKKIILDYKRKPKY